MRKFHFRTRSIDDSRTRPALLQELQDFLHHELDGGTTQDLATASKTTPSLRRLQVVREAFDRLIEGFSVYAPVLVRIRDEYEYAVEALHARSLLVPGLHTRLESVETQCLRQLSACSAEAKARSRMLKHQLADTQALLAASAAENARLKTALQAEKTNIVHVERKLVEVQKSTLALANSVRRHDESVRAGQERSFEDAKTLEKVTSRYYHACDELAELKRTIAAFEEQGNGERVAADKDTIVLLSRELQEVSTSLANCSNVKQEDDDSKHAALNRAFVMGLDAFGLKLELSDLLHGIASKPTISEGVTATAASITERLRQVQQQQYALLRSNSDGDQQSSIVFLTEPAEIVSLDSWQLGPSSASEDFIRGRGMGVDVPAYLQHDGLVRNLFFSRVMIEQLAEQVWDQLDDQLRFTHAQHSSTRVAGNEVAIAALYLASGASLLASSLERFLQRSRDTRADRVELVYNFLSGLERFSTQSSVCKLFHHVLNQELPIEARTDQSRELARLHEALVVVDGDHQFANTSSENALIDSSIVLPPPGRVSFAEVVRTLRLTFPWKSDSALSQLHRALLLDVRGHSHVDYTALLSQHSHVATGVNHSPKGGGTRKSQFAECLKMQHLNDLLTFRLHLQEHIRHHVVSNGNDMSSTEPLGDSGRTLMISVHDLRACLHSADAAMAEPDVTRILVAVSGLSARELLAHDDMVLDMQRVLQRLPTLLLRPTGRLKTEQILQ